MKTSDEQERQAWSLVRESFRYGSTGTSPADWMASRAWTPGTTTTLTELGDRHGRPVPPEFARAGVPRVWFFDGAFSPV
jgi:hypothetical protein